MDWSTQSLQLVTVDAALSSSKQSYLQAVKLKQFPRLCSPPSPPTSTIRHCSYLNCDVLTETRLSSNPATEQPVSMYLSLFAPFLAGSSLFGNVHKRQQGVEVLHLSNSLTCVLLLSEWLSACASQCAGLVSDSITAWPRWPGAAGRREYAGIKTPLRHCE